MGTLWNSFLELFGSRTNYIDNGGFLPKLPPTRPDLWENWKGALVTAYKDNPEQELSSDDHKQLLSLVEADNTIAKLERSEQKFKALNKLDPATDPVTIREMAKEQEKGALLDILHRLDHARKQKNDTLIYFANLFKFNPIIPSIGFPGKTFPYGPPFDPSHTWAVIIGINTYKSVPLRHAAHDALCFNDYLVERSVSPGHIHLLVDDEDGGALPTRKAILDALYDLRDNPEIKHGDTIIIWYSGHGVAYDARRYWPGAIGRIEALAPVDRGEPNVPDISDRELNLFLTDLARSKGNNITVILDCCYAVGAMRDANTVSPCKSADVIPRCTRQLSQGHLKQMLKAPESYERRHWDPELALAHPVDWKPDHSSHVLIAACHDTERAYEDKNGGVFTSAFIGVLWNENLASVTYRQLLGRIGRIGSQQTPAVAGDNTDCLIFRIPQQTKIPSFDEPALPATTRLISAEHSFDKLALAATTRFIAAERALQHLETNLPRVDEIFLSFKIPQSDYSIHAGFDEEYLQERLGYLEQIHVFIRDEVPDMSSLISQLASVFAPFTAILFTQTSHYYIPVTPEAATSAAGTDKPMYVSRLTNSGLDEYLPVITVCQTHASVSNSGYSNDSGSGAESNGKNNGENNERSRDTNEDKQFDGTNEDGGGPEPGPGPGNTVGPMSADIFFGIVSEICSSRPDEDTDKVAQELNTNGRLLIKRTPESGELKQFATCNVEFTQLRFANNLRSEEMNYAHFLTTVVINSKQENADITDFKPERTLEFTRESKVTSASKIGWNATASAAVMAAFTGLQATFGANTAYSSEKTTGSERTKIISKITEVDLYGAIEWGFHVSDHNERYGGMRMQPEDLPMAHFKFVGNNDIPAPPPLELYVEVSTDWSSLPRNGHWSLNLGKEPFYSNVRQITALVIPSNLQGKYNYQATLRVFPPQAAGGFSTTRKMNVRRNADPIKVSVGIVDKHGNEHNRGRHILNRT